MTFSKGFYTRNYRYGIRFELFPQTAKNLSEVYHTGFHHWLSEWGSCRNLSVVIGRFRIIVNVPTGKIVGYCKGEIRGE